MINLNRPVKINLHDRFMQQSSVISLRAVVPPEFQKWGKSGDKQKLGAQLSVRIAPVHSTPLNRSGLGASSSKRL